MIDAHIAGFRSSVLGEFSGRMPWELTLGSIGIVERLLSELRDGYDVTGSVAIHHTSTVESGAIIKGPVIIGPDCFIAAGALKLYDSYHCSRYNTNTRVLTPEIGRASCRERVFSSV